MAAKVAGVPARPPAAVTLSRRSAVLGLAAGVLLAGCDHGDDIGSPDSGRTTTTPGPSSSSPTPTTTTTTTEQTPDEQLVDEVVGQLNGAIGVLESARRRPDLHIVLTPLLKAHRQHLEALDGESQSPSAAAPRATLQDVRRSEKQLRSALVDAAGNAGSGALAKLLASMSASVTQHLDALPQAAR